MGSRPDWAAVGRTIGERRRALGLPKNEAARRAGVSNTTWRLLETGANHNPTDETLVRVAGVIGIDAALLFRTAGRAAPKPITGGGAASAGGAPPVPPGRRHPPALPSTYPRDRTPYFLGRTELLENIARYLERREGTVRPLVLSGPPGSGKTEIAARYMADRREAYEGLAWVNATSLPIAAADLSRLADEVGAEPVDAAGDDERVQALARAVSRKLLGEGRRWLLVIDDVERGTVAMELLQRLIADGDNVRILMTSRRGVGWRQATRLPIGPLAPEDAAEFLRQRTGSLLQRHAGNEDPQADDPAAALAAELGGLPRALDWAGAYVDKTGISLSGFLSLAREMSMRDQLLDLLEEGLSGEAVKPDPWLSELGPSGRPAPDLVRIMAFLAPEPLDPSYLARPTTSLPESLQGLRKEYLATFSTLARGLQRLSQVVVHDDGLHAHPITQAAVRRSLSSERNVWASRALDLLISVFPHPDGGPADHAACLHLLPHAQAAIRHATLHGGDGTALARLLGRVAEHHRLAGDLRAAGRSVQGAIDLLTTTEVPASEVVSLRQTRALVHVDLGEFEAARTQFEHARAASEAPEVQQHTVELMEAQLAVIDAQLGHYDRAYQRVEHVSAFLEQQDDGPTPQTTELMSAIALALKFLDEVDEARRCFASALTHRRTLMGTRHHNFAFDCLWLASVELRAEQPHRAAYWFQLSLDIFKELYGPDATHPRIGDCLRGLAAVNRLAGDLENALDLLQKADAVYHQAYGFEHPVRQSVETTRDFLSALLRREADSPHAASDPDARPFMEPPPAPAVQRYTQQKLAIGNLTRGFGRDAEAVTALRLAIRLLDFRAFDASLANLTASMNLAEPGSLLALNAQMRRGQVLARRNDKERNDADEARRAYEEIIAVIDRGANQGAPAGADRVRERATRELEQLEKATPAILA